MCESRRSVCQEDMVNVSLQKTCVLNIICDVVNATSRVPVTSHMCHGPIKKDSAIMTCHVSSVCRCVMKKGIPFHASCDP